MLSHEDMVRELNEEFEEYLGDMKPHVLQLQLKSERQRCALWIKKLCEPHTHSGLEGRRLRNVYAKALLNMLRKGIMEGPLLHRPPEGKLDQFPAYLEEYIRDPEPDLPDAIPDWLTGLEDDQSELGAAGDAGYAEYHYQPKQSSSSDADQPSRNAAARERLEDLLANHKMEEQLDLAAQTQSGTAKSPNRKRSFRTVKFPSEAYSSPLDEVTNRRTAASSSFHMSSEDELDYERDRRRQYSQSPDPGSRPDERHKQRSLSRAKSPLRSRLSQSPIYREHYRQLERNFEREVDMKVKVIENKLYEERLLLQQKNDEEIQKILDRKNSEIDEVKGQYKKKLEVSEEEVGKLEKKMQSVLRDAQIVRENKDSQIAELKKLAEESSTAKMNSMEKKFHDLQTEHEQEKIELQKAQTASIQQLMDETTSRLQKMEDDYRKQSKAMADTIRELEKRIQVLTLDAERVNSARQALEQNKIELESKLDQLSAECSEYRIKYDETDREHKKAVEDHQHAIELLKEKHESQLNFARKEHQLTVTKNSDTIASLEEQLNNCKQALQEVETQRQRQVRELEQSYKQDQIHAEKIHDKKVRNLQKEMEQQESDYKKRIRAMESSVSEYEKEIGRLKERINTQAAQAEAGLQEIRKQVEKQQEEVSSDMKQQIQQVEVELEKSKQARREQTEEFEAKIKEIAAIHEKEVKALREAFEEERSNSNKTTQQQKEQLADTQRKELELLKKNAEAEKEQLEKTADQRKADSETKINELCEQVHELKEELAQSESLHKQQVMELGLVREEEMQRLRHEQERAVERMKSEFEREKHSLQKQHSADLEGSIEKTNSKLKSIESDYTDRLTKQAEQLAELQLQLEQAQADRHQLTDQLEAKVIDNSNKYEEEKRALRKHSAATIMALRQEVEGMKLKLRQTERQTQNQLADHEEDLIQLKLEYEEKMRGLIPSDAREQLEATVSSLKNQVNTLKQRIAILQDC